MNLGHVLNRLDSEADAAEALAALGDLSLFARVEAMGALHDESPGAYVANAARRFASRAGDEDWLGLMTAMERAANPGQAALLRILTWSLNGDQAAQDGPRHAHEGCSCGGGGGGCHERPAG